MGRSLRVIALAALWSASFAWGAKPSSERCAEILENIRAVNAHAEVTPFDRIAEIEEMLRANPKVKIELRANVQRSEFVQFGAVSSRLKWRAFVKSVRAETKALYPTKKIRTEMQVSKTTKWRGVDYHFSSMGIPLKVSLERDLSVDHEWVGLSSPAVSDTSPLEFLSRLLPEEMPFHLSVIVHGKNLQPQSYDFQSILSDKIPGFTATALRAALEGRNGHTVENYKKETQTELDSRRPGSGLGMFFTSLLFATGLGTTGLAWYDGVPPKELRSFQKMIRTSPMCEVQGYLYEEAWQLKGRLRPVSTMVFETNSPNWGGNTMKLFFSYQDFPWGREMEFRGVSQGLEDSLERMAFAELQVEADSRIRIGGTISPDFFSPEAVVLRMDDLWERRSQFLIQQAILRGDKDISEATIRWLPLPSGRRLPVVPATTEGRRRNNKGQVPYYGQFWIEVGQDVVAETDDELKKKRGD